MSGGRGEPWCLSCFAYEQSCFMLGQGGWLLKQDLTAGIAIARAYWLWELQSIYGTVWELSGG